MYVPLNSGQNCSNEPHLQLRCSTKSVTLPEDPRPAVSHPKGLPTRVHALGRWLGTGEAATSHPKKTEKDGAFRLGPNWDMGGARRIGWTTESYSDWCGFGVHYDDIIDESLFITPSREF